MHPLDTLREDVPVGVERLREHPHLPGGLTVGVHEVAAQANRAVAPRRRLPAQLEPPFGSGMSVVTDADGVTSAVLQPASTVAAGRRGTGVG